MSDTRTFEEGQRLVRGAHSVSSSCRVFRALSSLDAAREEEERNGKDAGGTAERDVAQPPRADPPGVPEVHVRFWGNEYRRLIMVDISNFFFIYFFSPA